MSLLRRTVRVIAVLAGVAATTTTGYAQAFPGFPVATPGPGTAGALDALYATAPIVLDGITLFRIAVAISGQNQEPVAVRANAVNVALDQVLATDESVTRTVFDPHTLHVEIVRTHGAVTLDAVDERHRDGLPLVTVTAADAEYQQVSVDALAAQWQDVLRAALVHALTIRQPEIQRENRATVVRVAGGVALATILGYFVLLRLSRRIGALATNVQKHDAELAAERAQIIAPDDDVQTVAHRTRLVSLLIGILDPAKQLTLARALRISLTLLLVLAWFGALTWATLQFPQTAAFGNALLRNGFAVATIWIVALLVDRALTITVERLPTLWELRAFGSSEEKQRQLLRAPTIARALAGLKTFVLAFVAILATMTQLGIPVGSVVTIGGVAAIAVSLAAQNLIRDVVSGFLVLIEDQFVVGDYVTINGNRGSVERLTLRMVQIRDATGSLVTIAHSSATSVVNHSRNWSRVDYEISVDVASDVPAAIALIQAQIASLEDDANWRDAIVEPAEWIGIEGISRDGAIVRARIKTAPLRQYALRRELNARVSAAFSAAKIAYGAPAPPLPP